MSLQEDTHDYDEFDLKEELADAVIDGAPNIQEFQIENEAHLGWFSEKLEAKAARIRFYEAMRDKKLNKLRGIFEREVQRIHISCDEQCEEDKKSMTFLIARFGNQARMLITELVGKAKTRSKKYGAAQVGFRKIPARLHVKEAEELKNWALINDAERFVKLEESVRMAELQAHYTKTGEIPDGASVVGGQDEFYFKVHGQNVLDILGENWLKGQNPFLPPEPPEEISEQPEQEKAPV